MRIYLDIDTRQLMSSTVRAIQKIEFKRGDSDTLELIFLRDGAIQELPAGTIVNLGIKINAGDDIEFLSFASLSKSGSGEESEYTGTIQLNTAAIETAFADEPPTVAAFLEIEWRSGSAVSSSQTLPVVLNNDIIRGNEGEPVQLPIFYLQATDELKTTQAEAEAGTNNDKWMTPLRTAQAIAAAGAGPHTHPLADLQQSGASSGQVATWNGTAWVPATPSGGGGGGTPSPHATSHATGGSDEITPASVGAAAATHTHVISDVTGLQTALTDINPSAISGTAVITTDARLSDSRTPTAHTHTAADISSGTLAIARIPTGTTTTTVCLGNDVRLSDSRTPTSHTHGNITNAGAIGTTSGVPIITGTSGVIQVGSFGTSAGTFCQGNDSRLVNLSGGITAIAVVSALPATPSATTLYIVTG